MVEIPLPFYEPLSKLPGLELNQLIDFLLIFILSSIRLSSFLISSPFLGSRNIPLHAKIVFSMILSFFFFGQSSDMELSQYIIENLFFLVMIEILIGVASGLSLTVWFSAASMAGEKIAASTGLGFSALVDPETGGQTPVLSVLLDLFLLTIFVSLNGHLLAINLIVESYEVIEVGSRFPGIALIGSGIEAAGAMFYTAGLIMLPIVGGLLLTNIAIGVITKSAPTLNLFSFGFPITIMIAFVLLFFATRSIGGAFAELVKNSIENLEVVLGVI